MIAWLLGTRIGRFIAGALALVGAIAGVFLAGRREGGQKAKSDMKEADHERAEDIRGNVRDNLDDRVRDHDDSGWRD